MINTGRLGARRNRLLKTSPCFSVTVEMVYGRDIQGLGVLNASVQSQSASNDSAARLRPPRFSKGLGFLWPQGLDIRAYVLAMKVENADVDNNCFSCEASIPAVQS